MIRLFRQYRIRRLERKITVRFAAIDDLASMPHEDTQLEVTYLIAQIKKLQLRRDRLL